MRFINFVVSLAFAFGLFGGSFAYLLFAQILSSLGLVHSTAATLSGWLAFIGTIAVSFVFVKKTINFNAMPTTKTTAGHVILGLANIAALATTCGPLLYAQLSSRPDNALYLFYSLPVLGVNLVLWPIGWILAIPSKAETS